MHPRKVLFAPGRSWPSDGNHFGRFGHETGRLRASPNLPPKDLTSTRCSVNFSIEMVKTKNKSETSGKRKKVFVDHQDAALDLAKSIGEVQEDKAKKKVDRLHHHQRTKDSSGNSPGDRKARSSSSAKQRLKQVKAALVADRARAKKEKAKLRKEARKSGTSPSSATEVNPQPNSDTPTSKGDETQGRTKSRKRVAFA
ncbi:hypothetical protein BXZ70DRAFT_186849 [Cristinia sonorae]|uniref:Uncharacterized protein n=1 Tax=Cristinia sonorae TaxID=1940300 RepID=A0A8K0UN82_9AGAR|nr:hypothetical protein BXZ70DRAFT_186849 [Cristinia sonorae]